MDITYGQLTKPLNTQEMIVEAMRQAILRGNLKSHQPLRQDKIAAQFGVSKIPVREALVQLKAEGLVRFKTNRGAFVSALSSSEANEIYLMRIALERIALEHAIPKLTKSDLARAESVLMVIDAEDDPTKWGELNWEFHAALYQPAKMPHLLDMIQILHRNVARYLVLYLADMDYQSKSQTEHHAILEACREQDIEQAVTLLQGHLHDAGQNLVTFLAK
ncbi:MAG: GntR family transcriptional regulator [Ardenticatenaceae bacterium]